MRGDAGELSCLAPVTLDEALAALAAQPGALTPLAGGTDLLVMMAAGRLAERRFLGLWRLAELRTVEVLPSHVTLGALTTYTQVQRNPLLRVEFPALVAAAAETGGLAIQNRGTLGGNLANASPAADSSPPLLVYDAELELASAAGRRWVLYRDFHTAYKKTLRRPDELITRIRLPRTTLPRMHTFRKVGPRRAQAISKVCLAAVVDRDQTGKVVAARIAFGGVAPTVVRCPAAEAAVVQGDLTAARAALAHDIHPIDDIRSTAAYRLRVAQNLLSRI
jgi:CO/xanthine dehydrogenase FAD-binding subunit